MSRNKKPRPCMNKEDGKEIFWEVTRVLDSFSAEYFLLQGTALGAYRDQGFVPTERDIDLGFLQENLEPLAEELEKAFISLGYETWLIKKPFHKWRALKVRRKNIKVDMVAYQIWKGWRFCSSNLTEYSIVHPREQLETVEPVEFFGEEFAVPSPIEGYLEREYGEDWKTPKDDHVSKSRVNKFRQSQGIPNDLLGPPKEQSK